MHFLTLHSLFSPLCFSAINPILYNAMSDKFRKAFRRLLSCGKLSSEPTVAGGHNHLYCYQNALAAHPSANTNATGTDKSLPQSQLGEDTIQNHLFNGEGLWAAGTRSGTAACTGDWCPSPT